MDEKSDQSKPLEYVSFSKTKKDTKRYQIEHGFLYF